MQSEVTVILKGEDSTFRKKFNSYDKYSVDTNDHTIQGFIQQAKEEYKGTPEEVWVKISLYVS
jgi:hypothetical protein